MADLAGAAYTCFVCMVLACLECVFAPFARFTFTDFVDYIPVAASLATPLCVAGIHRLTQPTVRVRRNTLLLYTIVAAAGPATFLAALYRLGARAATVLGHWPMPMIDDPQFTHDAAFSKLESSAAYASAYSGWLIVATLSLGISLALRLQRRTSLLILAMPLIGWMLFAAEPRHLFEWWLD